MNSNDNKLLKDCTIEEVVCYFGMFPILDWFGVDLLESFVGLKLAADESDQEKKIITTTEINIKG